MHLRFEYTPEKPTAYDAPRYWEVTTAGDLVVTTSGAIGAWGASVSCVCGTEEDARQRALTLGADVATWKGYSRRPSKRRAVTGSGPFARDRAPRTPSPLLPMWDDPAVRAAVAAAAAPAIAPATALALDVLASDDPAALPLDVEAAAIMGVLVPTATVVEHWLGRGGPAFVIDAAVRATQLNLALDPWLSSVPALVFEHAELWSVVRTRLGQLPPEARAGAVDHAEGLRATASLALRARLASLFPERPEWAHADLDEALAGYARTASVVPLIAVLDDLASVRRILTTSNVVTGGVVGMLAEVQPLPRYRAAFSLVCMPYVPDLVRRHGEAARELLVTCFRAIRPELAEVLWDVDPEAVARALVRALDDTLREPPIASVQRVLERSPELAIRALAARTGEPEEVPDGRRQVLELLATMATAHPEAAARATLAAGALPAAARLALTNPERFRRTRSARGKVELVETDVAGRPDRLDLDARDFRRIDPEDLDALISGWLVRADAGLRAALESRGLKKLAGGHKRAFAKSTPDPRDWMVGLWKWAHKATEEGGLDPVTGAMLGEYANALRLVVQGHYDGDFGTDHGIGAVALAEFIPYAAGLAGEPGTTAQAWDEGVATELLAELEEAKAGW